MCISTNSVGEKFWSYTRACILFLHKCWHVTAKQKKKNSNNKLDMRLHIHCGTLNQHLFITNLFRFFFQFHRHIIIIIIYAWRLHKAQINDYNSEKTWTALHTHVIFAKAKGYYVYCALCCVAAAAIHSSTIDITTLARALIWWLHTKLQYENLRAPDDSQSILLYNSKKKIVLYLFHRPRAHPFASSSTTSAHLISCVCVYSTAHIYYLHNLDSRDYCAACTFRFHVRVRAGDQQKIKIYFFLNCAHTFITIIIIIIITASGDWCVYVYLFLFLQHF